MDGDGEGVIAIIQALRVAGMAITVMDGKYRHVFNLQQQTRDRLTAAKILALQKSIEMPQYHPSMENNTMEKSHKYVQIGNDRYARSNEMPMGDDYHLISDSLYTKRSAYSPEFINQTSRDYEEFVYSLRKYPKVSPERISSSEMVQRLINYTQSKNSKRWHQSKSMRSLPDTNIRKDKQTSRKSCKDIKTDSISGNNSPVKDTDVIVNNFQGTPSRNLRLRSPISDFRIVRFKDNDRLNETYDYLKNSTPTQRNLYRSPELRYLTDVTRYVKDTIRQIYEDRPSVCQKMMDRYTEHEKQYHPGRQGHPCDHNRPRIDSMNKEVQASRRRVSKGVTAHNSKNVHTDSPSPSCSKSSHVPRDYTPQASFMICVCPKKIIDDAIKEWVKTIPINSAESQKDKEVREDIIKELGIKLKEMVEDDDFNNKSREEISKYVKNMPIWESGNVEHQDTLKNEIVEKLYSKIKNVKNKDLLSDNVAKKHVVNNLDGKVKPLKIQENKKDYFSRHIKKEVEDSTETLPIAFRGTRSGTVKDKCLINVKDEKVVPNESSNRKKSNDEIKLQEHFKNSRNRTNNTNNMVRHMPNVSTEDVEELTSTISEVLLKEQKLKIKEELQHNSKLSRVIDKDVSNEIKMLLEEWSNKMANLESSIQKDLGTENLSKQLLEIKSTNTNIKDMIKQMQHVLSNQTVEEVTSKLVDVLAKDKKERQKEEEFTTNKFTKIINEAVRTEIKALIVDCNKNIDNMKKSIDKNSITEDIAKQLQEIKSMNIYIEELLKEIKSDIPSETVINVTEKLTKILEKDQELKRNENEYNNTRLKSHVETVVCREVQKIINEWKNNSADLQTSVEKNDETGRLMELLLDIKCKNANIEEMIDQLQYTTPKDITEEVTTKLSKILINEQQSKFRNEDDIDRAVSIEVRKLIINWSNDIENRQCSIYQNIIKTLTRQLLEVTFTNANMIDMVNEMQNTIKKFLETLTLQKSDERANNEISNIFMEKIQDLEKLIVEKVYRVIDQGHLNNYSISQNQNNCFSGEEQGMNKEITSTSTNIKQTSLQTASESFERIKTYDSPRTSKNGTINIPNNKIRRMEAMEDVDLSYGSNSIPKQRLKNYYKDKHSLTDTAEDISDVKIDFNVKNEIDELLKRIQQLQTQGSDQDIILDEIDDWLDALSKKSGVDILIKEREAIAKKLLEYLEQNKPRKRWDRNENKSISFVNDISDFIDAELLRFGKNRHNMKNKTVSILESSTDGLKNNVTKVPSGDLKDLIREELKEMLEHYRVELTNKELEDMISHMLADQIMRGVDSDKSREKVYSMLQEDNISKSKAADISMKLADRVREMSLAHKAKDSNIVINKSKRVQAVSPFHNDAFKSNAERVILDFIDEFTNDPSFVKQTNFKQITSEFIILTADILLEPNENTEDLLKDEIWNYFNNIFLQSDIPVLDLVDELSDRVLSIVMNASTPRKEKRSVKPKQDVKKYSIQNKLTSKRIEYINTSKNSINGISNGTSTKDLCSCEVKNLRNDYNENLLKIISKWIEDFPVVMNEKFKSNMVKDLASDIYDRQKYLQLNSGKKTSDKEELDHLKYQVFRWLNNLPGVGDFSTFMPRIENLMQKIKEINVPVLVKGAENNIIEETYDSIVEEWFETLPLQPRKTCTEIIEVERLKADFKCRLEHLYTSTNVEAMRTEIMKFLLNLPLDPEKNNDEFINEKFSDLMELLGIRRSNESGMYGDSAKLLDPLEDSIEINRTILEDNNISTSKQENLSLESIILPNIHKKPCNSLSDYIIVWFENLSIIADSVRQAEVLKILKQSLASQLINKIGEININQDIFNDDYLYREILKDEINGLLSELPMNTELEEQLPDLKENLICKTMEAREKIKQDMEGQKYKRNLKDVISKSLPLLFSADLEDLAELDVLKDNLADAYMNLYFYGADNYLKDKYKVKITDAVTKFCATYLNRHPQASVDSEKLYLELFDALENVEVPNEEIIIREIEQSRIRDDVNDWIKQLPLKEQTKMEHLQRNKMIALLAKKLHDVDNNSELDENQVINKMKNEILNFLYKLPLFISDSKTLDNYTDKLIDILNGNASSRRYSASKTLRSLRDQTSSLWKTINDSIDKIEDRDAILRLDNGTMTEKAKEYTNLDESVKDETKNLTRLENISSIPQSTLSTADRAHLEEIRGRTFNASTCKPSCSKKDAAVNPLPTDVATQINLIPTTSENSVKMNSSEKLSIYPKSTCPSTTRRTVICKCQSPRAASPGATHPSALFPSETSPSEISPRVTSPSVIHPKVICSCSTHLTETNPNQTPSSRRYENPMVQPFKPTSPMQDIVVGNTDIDGSQDMQSGLDQPRTNRPNLNSIQNEEINRCSECQQQKDLIGPSASRMKPVGVIEYPNSNEKTCPGIQKISECYYKTCPSVREFLRQDSSKISAEKTPYTQKAETGSSKQQMMPQVIIKEYYLDLSNESINRHQGRSCISINSRGDQTRTHQGRFPSWQYTEEFASRPTQTSCSNIEFRSNRNFRRNCWVDDEGFWISNDEDTGERVKREERTRCRCRERVTKYRPRCTQRCPHPSCLHFR